MLRTWRFIVVVLILGITTPFNTSVYAQRNCQTMEYLQEQEIADPEVSFRMQAIERHTSRYQSIADWRSEEKIVIPVVVHIVYAEEAENLPKELIESQIAVLNEDFNRLNADSSSWWPQAASADIEFRLADFDPEGNPTSGVVRKHTSRSSFAARNAIKLDSLGGSDAWPATDYLNIWVGDLSGRQMGFAQFPGGGAAATDGVVVDYAYFGRLSENDKYGLGRTTTHEVGHWLNLRHIWGDGDCSRDDYIKDTPLASTPTIGCPAAKNTCAEGERDMTENFMDYTYDACMNLFTRGQRARMRTLFLPGGYRASILASAGWNRDSMADTSVIDEVAAEEPAGEPGEATSCPVPYNLSASVSNYGLVASWMGETEEYVFQLQLPGSGQWFGFTTPLRELRISGLRPGVTYRARIRSVCTSEDEVMEADWQYFTLSLDRFSERTEHFSLLPNPAREEVLLHWEQPDYQLDAAEGLRVTKPVTSVSLFNLMGQRLLSRPVAADTDELRLSVRQWRAGVYLVVIQDEDGRIVQQKKLVVL